LPSAVQRRLVSTAWPASIWRRIDNSAPSHCWVGSGVARQDDLAHRNRFLPLVVKPAYSGADRVTAAEISKIIPAIDPMSLCADLVDHCVEPLAQRDNNISAPNAL
jgi:hypothetical protein